MSPRATGRRWDPTTIVHIVDSATLASGAVTATAGPGGTNAWRFRAEYVPDFAFAVSDHYLWDASSLVVDPASGRRVLIDAAYHPDSPDFYEVAEVARNSIDYMSRVFPGVPFPYPQETVFNGADEMEYPMMVNDRSIEDRMYMVSLTSHEIAHTYFPFYMGINETKYAWMDEGWASFIDFFITNLLHTDEPYRLFGLDELDTGPRRLERSADHGRCRTGAAPGVLPRLLLEAGVLLPDAQGPVGRDALP